MSGAGDGERSGPTDQPGVESRLKRSGSISYLHIPAVDVREAAEFYESVFGWTVHGRDTDRPSFEDATGNVGGAWMTDQAISRKPGLLLYIYVDQIDVTVGLITTHGGEIVAPAYPEGDLWVATFRDPAGNVLGLWQEGPR
ncbi:MAG: Glyoxalase family protein [Acidimicrobiaceae bacterium]|nr:Glyoxalase family protein [Acidimicrobiaceae bacterium]